MGNYFGCSVHLVGIGIESVFDELAFFGGLEIVFDQATSRAVFERNT